MYLSLFLLSSLSFYSPIVKASTNYSDVDGLIFIDFDDASYSDSDYITDYVNISTFGDDGGFIQDYGNVTHLQSKHLGFNSSANTIPFRCDFKYNDSQNMSKFQSKMSVNDFGDDDNSFKIDFKTMYDVTIIRYEFFYDSNSLQVNVDTVAGNTTLCDVAFHDENNEAIYNFTYGFTILDVETVTYFIMINDRYYSEDILNNGWVNDSVSYYRIKKLSIGKDIELNDWIDIEIFYFDYYISEFLHIDEFDDGDPPPAPLDTRTWGFYDQGDFNNLFGGWYYGWNYLFWKDWPGGSGMSDQNGGTGRFTIPLGTGDESWDTFKIALMCGGTSALFPTYEGYIDTGLLLGIGSGSNSITTIGTPVNVDYYGIGNDADGYAFNFFYSAEWNNFEYDFVEGTEYFIALQFTENPALHFKYISYIVIDDEYTRGFTKWGDWCTFNNEFEGYSSVGDRDYQICTGYRATDTIYPPDFEIQVSPSIVNVGDEFQVEVWNNGTECWIDCRVINLTNNNVLIETTKPYYDSYYTWDWTWLHTFGTSENSDTYGVEVTIHNGDFSEDFADGTFIWPRPIPDITYADYYLRAFNVHYDAPPFAIWTKIPNGEQCTIKIQAPVPSGHPDRITYRNVTGNGNLQIFIFFQPWYKGNYIVILKNDIWDTVNSTNFWIYSDTYGITISNDEYYVGNHVYVHWFHGWDQAETVRLVGYHEDNLFFTKNVKNLYDDFDYFQVTEAGTYNFYLELNGDIVENSVDSFEVYVEGEERDSQYNVAFGIIICLGMGAFVGVMMGGNFPAMMFVSGASAIALSRPELGSFMLLPVELGMIIIALMVVVTIAIWLK